MRTWPHLKTSIEIDGVEIASAQLNTFVPNEDDLNNLSKGKNRD